MCTERYGIHFKTNDESQSNILCTTIFLAFLFLSLQEKSDEKGEYKRSYFMIHKSTFFRAK